MWLFWIFLNLFVWCGDWWIIHTNQTDPDYPLLEISWQGAQSSFSRTNRRPRSLLGLNQSAGALEHWVSVGSWLPDTEAAGREDDIIRLTNIWQTLYLPEESKMVSLDLYTQNIPLTQVFSTFSSPVLLPFLTHQLFSEGKVLDQLR